ncbi:MAG: DUF1549 domain-containing protein [Planctomycetota bacterium]
MLRFRLLPTMLLLAATAIRQDLVAAVPISPMAASPAPRGPVRPAADPSAALQLLKSRCWSCHGAEKRESGLRLDQREHLLSGGDSGPAAVPGDSLSSRLMARITSTSPDDRMPPEGPSLTAAETSLLAAWIDTGAAWPEGVTSTEAPRHWAWQPLNPQLPQPPPDAPADLHEIDRLIHARLRQAGLSPAPPASRETLIRRATLDLTGLLPAPAEVDAFVADQTPGAWERVVDRLLASPHFGERWGRHWLDHARYADSDGYEKDNARPDAWRWRNWVIDAFNSDMPFDQFTIEQLAGDLLPSATPAQQLATAFHRQTLTNTEGGTDQEEFRVEACFDRTETTGAVWLGLTVGCARCHSHKYDPLSQREYYQMFAVFNNADETTATVPLPDADVQAWPERQAKYLAEDQSLQTQLTELRRPLLPDFDRWLAEHEVPPGSKPSPALAKAPEDVRAALAAGNGRSAAQTAVLLDFWGRTQPALKSLHDQIDTHRKSAPGRPEITVRVLTARTSNPRTTWVLRRGEFLEPIRELAVQPAAPSILPPLRSRTPGQPPDRLDFARWLVSPENPLVPRVAVNHIWARLFGQGLVRTVGDFGVRGEQPSHPELLDWLAARFSGRPHPSLQSHLPHITPWSRKQLIRLILTSATWMQASAQHQQGQLTDPLNRLLWRQNRLRVEGEIVRDISLQAAGLLTPNIGGPSVFPPLPSGVAELSYANNFRWTESTGPDRYRRGLYTFFKRTAPHPSLTTFDCPDANTTCIERTLSNTPLQALVTLNNDVFSESARGLAERLLAIPSGDAHQPLREGFRICMSREPLAEELQALTTLLKEFEGDYQQDAAAAAKLIRSASPGNSSDHARHAALTAVCRVLLNLDEFITRE